MACTARKSPQNPSYFPIFVLYHTATFRSRQIQWIRIQPFPLASNYLCPLLYPSLAFQTQLSSNKYKSEPDRTPVTQKPYPQPRAVDKHSHSHPFYYGK